MRKIIVMLAVTLLLAFGIVQVAAAAGIGWGGGGPRMLGDVDRPNPVEALNLTDQQITQMQEIVKNKYNQTRDLRIKLMDSMHELRLLQLQKNPDQAAIDAKIKEINELRDQLSSINQEFRQQCRSLLTEEQLAQINQFRGKMGHGFKGGFGARNGR